MFGAACSVLNHIPAARLLAVATGLGVSWFAFGVVVAVVLAVRHPRMGWAVRATVAATAYGWACLAYYLSDWLFAVPGMLRLREQVRAGTLPDPGGLSLVPDWQEWLFWTAAGVPAALVCTGVAALWVRQVRTRRRPPPQGSPVDEPSRR